MNSLLLRCMSVLLGSVLLLPHSHADSTQGNGTISSDSIPLFVLRSKIVSTVEAYLPNSSNEETPAVSQGMAVLCDNSFIPSTVIHDIDVAKPNPQRNEFSVIVTARLDVHRCSASPLPGLKDEFRLPSPWGQPSNAQISDWKGPNQSIAVQGELSATNGVAGGLVHSELFRMNLEFRYDPKMNKYVLQNFDDSKITSYSQDSKKTQDSYIGVFEGAPVIYGKVFPKEFN